MDLLHSFAKCEHQSEIVINRQPPPALDAIRAAKSRMGLYLRWESLALSVNALIAARGSIREATEFGFKDPQSIEVFLRFHPARQRLFQIVQEICMLDREGKWV